MSPRPPTTFSVEFRKALDARGVTAARLARDVGMRDGVLYQILGSRNWPSHPTAVKLADALDWKTLADMSRRRRTVRCHVCRARFLDMSDGANRAKYCSDKCRHTIDMRRHRKTAHVFSTLQSRRLAVTLDAVARFCGGCEPFGICRTADCALRAVSPLPFREPHRVAA